MFSFLEGYYRYNQVLVSELERLNTTFLMKGWPFTFRRIPFGLVNVGVTFQRGMEISFHGIIGKSVVVYLDDLIVYSKRRFDHLCHLKKIFEWHQKEWISISSKKSIFAVSEGNLLGHIITKSGIKVDPKRVICITHIPFLVNKKSKQSFLGKTNFLCKFISDYAQIVKPTHDMVRKDASGTKGKRKGFPILRKWSQKHQLCTAHISIRIFFSTP